MSYSPVNARRWRLRCETTAILQTCQAHFKRWLENAQADAGKKPASAWHNNNNKNQGNHSPVRGRNHFGPLPSTKNLQQFVQCGNAPYALHHVRLPGALAKVAKEPLPFVTDEF